MTPAATPLAAAPPDDPVRAALADPPTRAELLAHAVAALGRWLADQPAVVRRETAEEAVQETARRCFQKAHTFDPVVATPAAWLHGILNRVLLTTARGLRKRPVQPPADSASWDLLAAGLSPPDAVACRLDALVVLAKLTPGQREVLSLRYRDGQEYDAIAARLGITPAAARVQVCRALAAARTAVGEATP